MQSLRTTPSDTPELSGNETLEFRRTLKSQGLWPAMQYLNAKAPYRYSAVFRFEGSMLRNVCLVDRESPEVTCCAELPIADSYCVYVRESSSDFAVEHARMDCRVTGHPKAEMFQSYYGVPLLADDGALLGTICHFDERPLVLDSQVGGLLNEVAPFVAAALRKQ